MSLTAGAARCGHRPARWPRPGPPPPPSAPPSCDRAADLLRGRTSAAIFALLAREAGKTLADAVGELREAVDFLRYYADAGGGADRARARASSPASARGTSRWRSSPARSRRRLAAGNAVLAKPAEQTPLIAALAVDLLHQAGVPADGAATAARRRRDGGAALTRDPRVAGVAFTGSTETAQMIRRAMAEHLDPDRAADRRDRRPERDDRRQHRAARTGGARYPRLGLPVGRPALFGAALPLRAGGRGRHRAPRCCSARWTN